MEKTVTIPLSEYDYLREQLKQLKEFDKEAKKEAYTNEAVQERNAKITILEDQYDDLRSRVDELQKKWLEKTREADTIKRDFYYYKNGFYKYKKEYYELYDRFTDLTITNSALNSQLNKLKSRNLWQRILNKY